MTTDYKRIDLTQIIRQLLDEKKQLDAVIASLELLEKPGTMPDHPAEAPKPRPRRGRRSMSADERRRVSERMKKYWQGRKIAHGAKDLPRTKTMGAGETQRIQPATEVRDAPAEKRKTRQGSGGIK